VSDTRTKVAASATLLAMGGLAGVALSAESPSSSSAKTPTTAPVEVRTQVVRRTVHVIRREKPKKATPVAKAAAPVAPTPVTAPAPVQRTATAPTRGGDDHGGDDARGRDD
jgi:hypothetical protein